MSLCWFCASMELSMLGRDGVRTVGGERVQSTKSLRCFRASEWLRRAPSGREGRPVMSEGSLC